MTDDSWTVEYINSAARTEMLALPADMQRASDRLLQIVATDGIMALRSPHVKSMGDGLWELRFGGKSGIARSLYVTVRPKRVVILHTFIKKTQATPAAALKLTRQRLTLLRP